MASPAQTTNHAAPGEGMSKQYRPLDHESRIRALWESAGAFHAAPGRVLRGEAPAYAVLIPPPNVTDRLHLGHALNNTLQDIMVRAHRMKGFETLWMPGTDHAGIATQAVVERRLRAEGKLKGPLRESLKREEFVSIVQSFKDEYEATITDQLRAIGCSCDWARQRFTMDAPCARAVREAFFRLFRDGLIYRGKRLVNWDPVLQTAIADDEVEELEVEGHFYYLRYPVVHPWRTDEEEPTPVTWSELFARGYPRPPEADDPAAAALYDDDREAWITVATTRPETYLGDTAVAVNPHDPRARALRDLSVELPLVGRIIPIVEDDYVVMPVTEAQAQAMRDRGESIDPKARHATGFLKVTPAHDPNDYEIWRRHHKEIYHQPINIMAPDATISDRHGWSDVGDAHVLVGLPREQARKKVIDEFKARTVGGGVGACLFAGSTPHRHAVKHSDRSKAAVEPYLSDQWYVRVTDEAMAARANQALADGSLRFHPARYARTYEQWHAGIRDWCISRQLWWGHRIPVWAGDLTRLPQATADQLSRAIQSWASQGRVATREFPAGEGHPPRLFVCVRTADAEVASALESHGFTQDQDVLDTWFSSGLWPMSTMGWPDPTAASADTGLADMGEALRAFNPSSTLFTAREIITLWVSRMVMFNRYLMPATWPGTGVAAPSLSEGARGRGPLPFRDVFIHALILDGEGRKMSKSLGNGVDPLDIVASHGSDAMRFTLCHMTTQTQDVRMPVTRDETTGRNTSGKFDFGRNFCNKLWNAARFALGILGEGRGAPGEVDAASLSLVDRWMLSRLSAGVAQADAAIKGFEFSDLAQTIYDLLWRDLCDWYLEAVKPTIASDHQQRAVLAHALEVVVRLLHPVCPFITEAIWEHLRHIQTAPIPGIRLEPSRVGGLLCTAGWPVVPPALRDPEAEREFEGVRTLVSRIREVRAQHQVSPKRRVHLHTPPGVDLSNVAALVGSLAGVDRITPDQAPASSVPFIVDAGEYRLSNLADEVDRGAEVARMERTIATLRKSIETLEGRLANPSYTERAPAAMVQQTRDQLTKARAELASAEHTLVGLRES